MMSGIDSPRQYKSPKSLYYVTAFEGLRIPKKLNSKACMLGFDISHNNSDICKSLVEGICFSIYDIINDMQDINDKNISRKIIVSGKYS